jgi:signal transduction histidine kinase
MKLRHRLSLFSVAQVLLFGCMLAIGYCTVEREVLPMADAHIRSATQHLASQLGAALEVPLGAEDPALVRRALAPAFHDPDFRYVEVQDKTGHAVFAQGVAPVAPFSALPNQVYEQGRAIRAWVPVTFESLDLGRVVVVLDRGGIDRVRAGIRWLAGIGVIIWMGVLVSSFWFARAFVSPIRAMMEFSRSVAAGDFEKRLDTRSSGELRELTDYLNSMTTQLAQRDAERKASVVRTAEMQREMLSLTRMAGMTEVATSVLHDVGNVLNSLNVSVSIVQDQLKLSKVASLGRTVKLLEDHPGGLTGFFTTERGAALPGYLASVAECLVEENTLALNELDRVIHNVDHIKAIVASQQTLVRVVGVFGSTDLREVVETALEMSESSLAKHRIEVVRDYADAVIVHSDRHKLLQMIINVASNARDAMRDSTNLDRRLTIRLRATDIGGAVIELADTGIGIVESDLPQIFRHGFTTKRDGHGFGLHASANLAQQLGGSIRVSSGGAGQGATFTIELPPRPPEGHDDRSN